MAKKHQRETPTVQPTAETPAAPAESPTAEAQPPVETVTEQVDPLLAEVQSFLDKRDELAQKLTDEITATERKLVVLRDKLASLFPEQSAPVPKPGKLKKSKPKSTSRQERVESDPTINEPTLFGDANE
ncbi:MAG TPA: hypothetical protein VL096_12320 [Pirellulaceae bacterium]|nr:hypothetical protein [Pirellulaceae bacterium]